MTVEQCEAELRILRREVADLRKLVIDSNALVAVKIGELNGSLRDLHESWKQETANDPQAKQGEAR